MDIQNKLPYETSPNLVLTLADHLAFAMERAQKGILFFCEQKKRIKRKNFLFANFVCSWVNF